MAEPTHLKLMKEPVVEVEDESLESSLNRSPSFRGRLDMSTFAFKPKPSIQAEVSSGSRRGSPRLSNSNGRTPSSSPGPITKRKASSVAASPSRAKKSRSPAGYPPPSKYAHLPLLPDVIIPNLICIFVGLNPGIETATRGHAYA